MNLQQLIEQYVVYRQTLGERFLTNAGILRAFSRMTGPLANVTDVRIEQINAFLQGNGPVTSTWHVRYAAFRPQDRKDHLTSSPIFIREKNSIDCWRLLSPFNTRSVGPNRRRYEPSCSYSTVVDSASAKPVIWLAQMWICSHLFSPSGTASFTSLGWYRSAPNSLTF
jgi:hypothetical protein